MDPACRRVLDELATKLRGYDDEAPTGAKLDRLLGRFGSSEDRCFEHCVFTLINHYANPRVGQAARLDLALQAILDRGPPASETEDTVRYAALYGRCMVARRNFARNTYRELLGKHGDWASKRFGTTADRGTFLHLQAMMHALEQDRPALDRALSCARRALEKLPNHVGVHHHYAELVAIAVEQGAIPREQEAARLREAMRWALRASDGEPGYAKLHATLGRLRALGPDPDFEEAGNDLLKAIETEAGSYDSDARRTDYKIMLAGVVQRRRLKEREQAFQDRVNEGIAEVRRAGEEAKTRHAEMLGFFSGVLALILTGLSLRGDGAPGPAAAAVILLLLAGVLLIAFAVLSYLMRDPAGYQEPEWRRRDADTLRRFTTSVCIGLLLVGLALVALRMLPTAGSGRQAGSAAAAGDPS